MADDETFMLSDDESVNDFSEFTSTPTATEKEDVLFATSDEPSSKLSFVPSTPNRHFVMEAAETQPSSDILSPVSETVMPDVTAPIATGEIHLSEAQLASVIAQISKEMIERIAWEVVPDLAEAIIKEEIRKIKQGY